MTEPQVPEEAIDRPLDPQRIMEVEKTIKTRLKTALANAGRPDLVAILDLGEPLNATSVSAEPIITNEVLEDGTEVTWNDIFGYIPGQVSIISHRIDKPLEEQGIYFRKTTKGEPIIDHRSFLNGRQIKHTNSTFMEKNAMNQVGQIEARLTPAPQAARQ